MNISRPMQRLPRFVTPNAIPMPIIIAIESLKCTSKQTDVLFHRRYEEVEDTDPWLLSDNREFISTLRPVDRRLDDSEAISYCCLVCWCMILISMSAGSPKIKHCKDVRTSGMHPLPYPVEIDQIVAKSLLAPLRVRCMIRGCRRFELRRKTW